jgi:putative glutamine amidotransferase
MSPLIGITTRRLPASALGAVPAGVVDAPIDGVFADYSESVAGAGGQPMLIPRAADPRILVALLDGLVLSGGEDVEPHRYGSAPDEFATRHDPQRDDFECSLIEAALAEEIPVLAICRGVQILNVALGGTLVGHLPPVDGFDHSTTEEHRSSRRHEVTVQTGCMLASVLAEHLDQGGRINVNSYHHQAVSSPGVGLAVVAHAFDGTVEAVEDPARRVLGVQWHPEMHSGIDPVFIWLIQQAREGKRHSA